MLVSSIPPPVGTFLTYPLSGHTIPRGYALTLGQAHYIAYYPELYAVIGTTYGNVGPGTFRFPKLEDSFHSPLLIYTGDIPRVPIG
jgi:hypothetical protein